MKLTDITPFIGAELTGVTYADLERQEVLGAFADAVARRQLVVIRGIEMTPRQQVALAVRLGRPVPFVVENYRHSEVPEILVSSNERKNDQPIGVARVGNFWH
ncbi:hypothetical protein NOGI109294_09410 [Nocardiopsis gilva]